MPCPYGIGRTTVRPYVPYAICRWLVGAQGVAQR